MPEKALKIGAVKTDVQLALAHLPQFAFRFGESGGNFSG
jgi:hypothetical protein